MAKPEKTDEEVKKKEAWTQGDGLGRDRLLFQNTISFL